MKGNTNSQRSNDEEKIVVSLKTNQSSNTDLINATFRVIIGEEITEYVWSGNSVTIKVPAYMPYTIEYGDVNGYKKPKTFTTRAYPGNDRFVTGLYNTELVTVKVGADKGTVSGYTILIKSGSSVLYTLTTALATYKIPYEQEYSIKCNDANNYYAPEEQLFTAGLTQREVNIIYEAEPRGVFIQGISGKLYTTSEWSSLETANGVAVLGDTCLFVVAKNDLYPYAIYPYSPFPSGLLPYENLYDDINGVTNTQVIVDYYGESDNAAKRCADYVFPNGQLGYLGASGELALVALNISQIVELLDMIGGECDFSDHHWSSTVAIDESFARAPDPQVYFWGYLKSSGLGLVSAIAWTVRSLPFASYIAKPKFISFTVNGVTFQCLEGTTWKGWCGSAFNTSGYKVSGSNVVSSNSTYKITNASPSDIITSKSYTHTSNISITWTSKSGGNWTSASNSSAKDGKVWTSPAISDNGSTVLRCTFSGITSITFNCIYLGESYFDYLTVGNIDAACTRSSYGTTLKGTSGTAKDITFTCNSNQHYVEFCYSKDSSVSESPDNATVYIKNYS